MQIMWTGDIHRGPYHGALVIPPEAQHPAPPLADATTTEAERKAMRALMADGGIRTIADIASALHWSPVKTGAVIRRAVSRGWLVETCRGRYQKGRAHTRQPALSLEAKES